MNDLPVTKPLGHNFIHMKIYVVSDITSFNSMKADVSEGHITSVFKMEGQIQHETGSKNRSADFHQVTRHYIPEIEVFIPTAVRTSNP
jgi:hypothetical protein